MSQMLLQAAAPTDRKLRQPKHRFLVSEFPFTAQPFMIAPVLPGESLANLYMEARVVTDPINNRLIGWKKEFYYFYVRVTDLLVDAIKDMFVDPTNTDLVATMGVAGHDNNFYHASGGIDYTKRCLKRIMETYFRDEGEAWDAHKTSWGIPFVQIREDSWLDSLTDKDLMPEGEAIASATDAGDLDRLMAAYEMLRSLGVSNMTYEDWLRSQGIAIPNELENKPELLCRFSEYQYPSNTIDPTTGAASSAVSWVFKNGNKDKKFFKEPGFVIGVSVTRPKVYLSGLAGSLAEFMGRAWDWMPGYLSAMPETSLKNFAIHSGPLGNRNVAADAYWVDMRDLLMYGDQFVNLAPWNATPPNDGANNRVALPDATLNHKNPNEAMVRSLFKSVDDSTVGIDGYTSLSILGVQTDYTKGNFAQV